MENGVGQYSEKPAEIAAIVAEWFGEKKGELIAMKERALKLARYAYLHSLWISLSKAMTVIDLKKDTRILVEIALAVCYAAFSFEQRFCFPRILLKNFASL